jgi:hypothetical protein
MVLGAHTFRQFVQLMDPSTGELKEIDPVNAQLRNIPTTVVSMKIERPPRLAGRDPHEQRRRRHRRPT